MEIIANAPQTVNSGANVLFTDTVVGCGNNLLHREGSGLVTLKGATQTQCRARYKVTYGGNIAIPADGTVEAISLALAINDEATGSATMIITPTATEAYNNVFAAVYIEVPRGCCFDVSIQNTSTQAILVQNSNLIVERTA